MIGYEMGSSPVVVYTTPKTSLVEDFKHEWKNDMVVCQHGNFFLLEEFYGGQVYWATSNLERINLTSKEFWFITLFSCMIVFHSVFNIWHRPPLPYLHGKKLRKEGESDANTNMVMLVWIIRILWIVLLFSIMELIWIVILGNNTGMSNVSYEDSWDEQIIIAYSAMSITPPKFPSFAQMYE